MGTKSVETNEEDNEFHNVDALRGAEASLGVTHNLGDFNSVRIDFRLKDKAEEGETAVDVAQRLFKDVEALVEEKLSEYETD